MTKRKLGEAYKERFLQQLAAAEWWKSNDREQQLIDLIDNQQLSFSQAAAELSTEQHPITTNSAIGKYHRLKERPDEHACPPLPPFPDNDACIWPIGYPGEPDFHYCNARAAWLSPYCAEHTATAYIQPPKGAKE